MKRLLNTAPRVCDWKKSNAKLAYRGHGVDTIESLELRRQQLRDQLQRLTTELIKWHWSVGVKKCAALKASGHPPSENCIVARHNDRTIAWN